VSNTRPQRPRLTVVGLAAAVLLASGALLAWARVSPGPGVAFLGVPDDVPQASDKSLGINTDLRLLKGSWREQSLSSLQAAGFQWLRQRFAWDAIEPEPGVYDWAEWDEIVDAAGRHNIRLIAVLDGSPRWARADADAGNVLAPPVEARDFGSFASAVACRYGDRIDHYQIWDEPNIAPHWGDREVSPEGYSRLLRESAIQIRAADPGAMILVAALAPNVEPGGANMSDLRYLDALYGLGAAPWFDIVAAQLYGFGEALEDPPRADRLNWARGALLRNVILEHGDAEAAVWAVSFGWEGQAVDSVRRAVEHARADWPWLGPMLWAAWTPGDVHGQFSVTDLAGQATGVFEPLSQLAAASDLAWPGVYRAEHASGEFDGAWRVTPLGADIGRTGDRLLIRFRGTRLDLAVRRGDYRAFLFAEVDGQPANALPRDSDGRAYVVLYDPLGETDTVTVARGLSDGEHVAEIVAERGWGQWALVGWRVCREADGQATWLALALSAASIAALGIVISAAWRDRRVYLAGVDSLVSRYRTLDARLSLIFAAGAAALFYVSDSTLASLALLSALGLLLLLRPGVGVPLLCLALPFYQVGKPLLGRVFSMVEILVLLTALAWAVDQVRIRVTTASRPAQSTWRPTRLDQAVLALLVLGAVSLLWAEHTREAAREFRTVVLEATLFYALARTLVRGSRDRWLVADAWVLGGTAIALIGIAQWMLGWSVITADGVWRVRGFYGSPNNLALYLGRVFPLTLAVVGLGARVPRKLLYGLAAVVIGTALVLTYSRGAWLLGIPASVVFLGYAQLRRARRARRALVALVTVLVVFVVLLILLVGTGRLTSLLDASEGTTFLRLQLWRSSVAMVRDHPFLGVGLDNFLYQYRTHYVLPTAWEEFDLSHPHNLVLDFWLRLGILGPAILCWLLVAFFRLVRKVLGCASRGADEVLALGLAGGVVSFAAHGLVDNAYFLVDLAFSLMLAMALVQLVADDRSLEKT
jgi:O-antigen ligase